MDLEEGPNGTSCSVASDRFSQSLQVKNKRLVSDHKAIANFRKDNVAVARGANSATLVHSRGIWGHVVYCAFLSYSRADCAFGRVAACGARELQNPA